MINMSSIEFRPISLASYNEVELIPTDTNGTALFARDSQVSTIKQAKLGECPSSHELVMVALTLPLWTFLTLYLVLLLIHYLRSKQYASVYDRCTWRNAHFRYDFHMIVGRHSKNYNRYESYAIIDLLDAQLISSLTIQIPGTSIFNDNQVLVYRHSRDDLRCVNFTVYRRHPIKDIKFIRIAHTCNSLESRIYIYGLEIHDQTNNENHFFPIQSVVKYRGTHWALATNFEPKPDVNFKKLGVDCYDPFSVSHWPSYIEVLTILIYIWSSNFCFGHLLMSKSAFAAIAPLVAGVFFITAISAAIISFLYLRFVKSHIVDNHYDSKWWSLAQAISVLAIIAIALSFWTVALNQSKRCHDDSKVWLVSTGSCSAALTVLLFCAWHIASCRRRSLDRAALAETNAQLAKTNSRENIMFASDPRPNFCISLCTNQPPIVGSQISIRDAPPKIWKTLGPQSDSQKARINAVSQKKGTSSDRANQTRQPDAQEQANLADDTADPALNVTSKYIKARNRNSIAQYV